MAGDTFDAGTVHAEARLGRDQFQKDVKAIRDDLRRLQKEKWAVPVRLSAEQFQADTRKLKADFEKATRGQFVIAPTLDEGAVDRQMRALITKWRKEQLSLPIRLDEAAFDAEVRRLEQRMKSVGGITVPVDIGKNLEEELANLSRKLAQAGHTIDVPVHLATEQAVAQNDALHAEVERPAVIPIDANTAPARSKTMAFLAWAKRQAVDVVVNIKMKDIRKAISLFNTWSYRLSRVGATMDSVGRTIDRNMTRVVTGLAKGATMALVLGTKLLMVGGAAIGIALASAAVLGLANNLKEAAWAGAALPGVILTMVGGIAALKVGMSGVGDALKNAFDPKNAKKFQEAMAKLHPEAQKFVRAIQSVAPEWKKMKQEVQGVLFEDLAKHIKPLSDMYLPVLATTLGSIAKGFNLAAQEVSRFLQQADTLQTMSTLGLDIGQTWYSLTSMIQPLVSIFIDLAAVALPFLRDTAGYLVPVVGGWADMVHEMRMSGELADKMAGGFRVVLMVLGLVQNVMSILNSVMEAASRAGFGVFENYTRAAGALAYFLKSAEGMALLDSFFRTLAQTMAIVQPFLDALGRALVDYVLPAVIQVLPIMAQAFAALAPAMGPLGQIIAAVLPLVVQLAVAFAQNLASAIIFLAPYIVQFANMLRDNPAAAAILAGVIGTLAFAFSHLGTIIMLIGKIMVFRQLQGALAALGAPGAMVNGVLNKMLGWMGRLGSAMRLLLGPVGLIIGGLIAMYMNSAPFRDAVNNLLGAIMGLIGSALQPFMTILGILAPVIGTIAGILGDILAPVVQFVADVIKFLQPVIEGLVWAWIAWTVATWALNSALLANPITWIILAIIALVAIIVLLVKNWDTVVAALQAGWAAFISFIQPVIDIFVAAWNAVAAAVSWAWNTVIYPVLQFLGTVLAWIGAIIFTVLVAPFVIAWNIISALVMAVVNNVLVPLWNNVMVPALQWLGSVMTWLWVNVVQPVWNGIVWAIQAAWAGIQIVWMLIQLGLQVLGAAFSWLWQNVIVPVWDGIMAAIGAAWDWLQAYVFQPIRDYLLGPLAQAFNWLWQNVIVPVWNGIQIAINAAWGFIQGIFNTLMEAVRAVGRVFEEVGRWIAQKWAEIREATRGPVQFVVDVVYNNGIRPVWNGIAGLFGLPQLGPVTMATGGVVSWSDAGNYVPPGFATGGVLGGYQPGRDSVLAMLSPGEGVLVPEAVKGLGVGFVPWANSFFAKGRVGGGTNYPQGMGNRMHNFTRDEKPRRYATGGVVKDGILGKVDPSFAARLPLQGFAEGGIVDWVTGAADTVFGFISRVFTDPVGAVRELFSAVLGSGANTPGQGSWTDALKQVPVKTVEGVIKKVKEWVESIMAMGGGGNWAPVILQSLAMVGQPPSLLGATQRRLMQESGGNPMAVNRYDSNWQRGTPSVGLMQVIGPTFAANAGPLRGVGPFLYGTSVNPLANIYSSMRYTLGRYGSLAAGYGRANGYANGGWMMPGQLGYNETGKPEMVFNQDQWRTLVRAGQVGTPESVKNSIVRRGGDEGSGNIGTLIVQAPEGGSPKEYADEAVFAWKHTQHGKYGGSGR